MKNNKRAFTLVELLIAMFLFAMLAVLLVPNVSNTAEKELFATQLKKVQNDLQQAMLLMTSQNQGTLEGFCAGGNNPYVCFTEAIRNRLEVNVKYGKYGCEMVNCNQDEINEGTCDANNQKQQCDNDDAQGIEGNCQNITEADGSMTNPAKSIKKQTCYLINKKPLQLDNQNFTGNGSSTVAPGNGQFLALNLTNGATVTLKYNPDCDNQNNNGVDLTVTNPGTTQICGYMAVDVNAGKGPDTLGKDIYFFWITAKEGIIPFGEIDQYTQAAHCANGTDGLGCAYRVIREGKITYY